MRIRNILCKYFIVVTVLFLSSLAITNQVAANSELFSELPPQSGLMDVQGINTWTYLGPEQGAPQVTQIVIDQNDPNIVYVATNQGVFRSVDGGESWVAKNGGLGSYGQLVVTGIVIDPSNSNTLYISTWGAGLLRSVDAGDNWTPLSDPLRPSSQALTQNIPVPAEVAGIGPSYTYESMESALPTSSILGMPVAWQRTAVRRVAINPTNAAELFACVDDGGGLYRSTDRGQIWEKVFLGTGSARTYTFAPSNPEIRYASFGSWSESGGFYRTIDGGAQWTEIPTTTISATVIAVAIHPQNPSVVLAGTSGAGLYWSIDGGNSWSQVNSSESTFFSVAFAPSDPNTVYAGGFNWVYRSTNGGATWSNADTDFPAWYIEGLAIHPTQAETVLVGSNTFRQGGVYKRTATTSSFVRKPDGMQYTIVLDVEQDPNNSHIWYASTWGGGIFRSDDNGITWSPKNSLSVPYIYDIEATRGPTGTILYAATFYSDWGILKSYDHGDTWHEVSRSYPSYIAFDLQSVRDDPNYLVAATFAGIQYSADGAKTWSTASGLGTNTGIVLRLCAFPNTDRLLAATYGGGVFYSSYRGQWWYEANTGITSYSGYQFVFDVACSPNTPGLAYAAALGMYRTTDYGETWTTFNSGIPPLQFRTVDIASSTGDVFAGAYDAGVYLADYGSNAWRDISTGLLERRIRSLQVANGSPVRALAGTNGSSIWEYTISRPVFVPTRRVYLPLVLRDHFGGPDKYEPNNSLAQAYSLPGPGTYYAYIGSASDEDWYRLDVTTLGPVTIKLTNIPVGQDYDIYLYTANNLQIGVSNYGGNTDEHIQFMPAQTGSYYLRVVGWQDSHHTIQAYKLILTYNGSVGAGDIQGVIRENGLTRAGVPVVLNYYNGYRVTRITTLTDANGAYNFRGMPSLPIYHYYQISYPNYERNDQRLGYWSCNSFRSYTAGQDYEACDFDIAGITLIAPPSGATRTFPITFMWQSRELVGDQYQVYLRRYTPSSAYYYSSSTTGSSHTLNSLPSGFSYGPTNYWSVRVWNDYGWGESYYINPLIFSSTVNNSVLSDEPPLVNQRHWFQDRSLTFESLFFE